MKIVLYFTILIAHLISFRFSNAQEVEIQYLANEGVLIKSKNAEVLIDAIFKKEFDYLDVLSDSEISRLENAEYPYKSINLVLATHVHGDHFDAQSVGKHLLANKDANFIGPQEVIDDFKENFESYKKIENRIKSVTPDFFKSENINFKNVSVKILRFEHLGTPPWDKAQNVSYLVTIGGKKILHLGDSKIDIKNLEQFDLHKEKIDVAILPYWQLGSPEQRDIIEKYINPKKILAAHIPPKSYESAQKNIDQLEYKNTSALDKQFKSITVK